MMAASLLSQLQPVTDQGKETRSGYNSQRLQRGLKETTFAVDRAPRLDDPKLLRAALLQRESSCLASLPPAPPHFPYMEIRPASWSEAFCLLCNFSTGISP